MTQRKAWAFTLDGHIFYVLGSHEGFTTVFDATTGQWCMWGTTDFEFWNVLRGTMWRGMILGADDNLPMIWEASPDAADDDGAPIARVVTGFLESRSRDDRRIGAARVTASVGYPEDVAVAVLLRFSDDEGETWSQPKEAILRAGDYAQELKYRSLGRLREPGRLWEISDAGGLVRIDGLDADIEGEEQEMPPSPGTST